MRGLTFCDGFFPFPVPTAEIWDGVTFYETSVEGVQGMQKRPSSTTEKFSVVCGPKTGFPFGPLTLEEASLLYWRVKKWRMGETITAAFSSTDNVLGSFGQTPPLPDVIETELSPEWMEERYLTIPSDKWGGLPDWPDSNKPYFFSLSASQSSSFNIGFDGSSYARFESDEELDVDDPYYPANGGVDCIVELGFLHQFRFVKTADGEYYGGFPFYASIYTNSGQPSNANEEGTTIAQGNSSVVLSPYYTHQIQIQRYDYDNDITTNHFIDVPFSGEDFQVDEFAGRNGGLGLTYGTVTDMFYTLEVILKVILPSKTINLTLYARKVGAHNVDDWSPSNQLVVYPAEIEMEPEEYWTYGGIYDSSNGAEV